MLNQCRADRQDLHKPAVRPSRRGGTIPGGKGTLCVLVAIGGLWGGMSLAQEKPIAQAVQPRPVQPAPMVQPRPEVAPPVQPGPGGIPPFGPRSVRLPRLPGEPGPLGTTPIPSKKELEEYNKFVDHIVDPGNSLDLVIGRPRLMVLKEAPTQTQIGDDSIATLELLSPQTISLLGRKVGTTVLNLWFRDPKNPGKEKILSYLVRVIPDPEAKTRLEGVYKALEMEVNKAFPDSLVHLFLVGDKLAVAGQAKDIAEGTQIIRVIRANAPPDDKPDTIPVGNLNLTIPPDPINAPGGLPTLGDFLVAGGANIINLLHIPGEQQVMLKVTVAEINRSAARSIGLNFSVTNNNGTTVFQNRTGNIATGGTAGLFSGFGSSLTGGAGGANNNNGFGLLLNNLPVALDNGQISLAINALRTLDYARSLAEPNLVAINGQTANFQAGGQFPVPIVSSGFGGGGGGGGFGSPLQGVNFIPFGVQLRFTPYITDKDRIRLNISANVSTRNLSTGTNIGSSFVSGLTTRNFQTTVELREGQTLAVAGLIQTNSGADVQRVPLLGDLPIINNLTGLSRIQTGEQELVVLITPELVHPLEPNEVSPLPGSDLFEPGDLEFYVFGRIEGRRPVDYRSPIRTDFHRMLSFRRCEETYIYGPSGHSEEPPVPPPPPPVAPPVSGAAGPLLPPVTPVPEDLTPPRPTMPR
jgi:pilus assembly protein CpaC